MSQKQVKEGRNHLLVTIELIPTAKPPSDSIKKISALLARCSKSKNIYKFKVTAEPVIVLIVAGDDFGDFEDILADISSKYAVKTSSFPLLPYENWAQILGVDSALTGPSPRNLTKKHLFWFELTVEATGMKLEEFLKVWTKEATAALSARSSTNLQLELFKAVWQRKVHVFVSLPVVDVEKMLHTLPFSTEMYDHMHINSQRHSNSMGRYFVQNELLRALET